MKAMRTTFRRKMLRSVVMALVLLACVGGVVLARLNPVLEEVRPEDLDFDTVQIPASSDTGLIAWSPLRNYAAERTLPLRSRGQAVPLYKFDLSMLPDSERLVIAHAQLKVFVDSRTNPTPLSASAYGIAKPWVVDEANWYYAQESQLWSQPGCSGAADRITPGSAPVDLANAGQWASFDVSPVVRSWISGTVPNNGIILASDSSTFVSVDLASAEHRDASLHPYLEVSYTVLPEPTPTPTPLPEIVVEKTGPAEALYIGEYGNITYDIEVTNPGMQAVSDVVVTDTLPVGTEFLSSSGSGVYDSESNSVVWTIESLMAGESQSFTVNVGVPTWVVGPGSLTNLVTGVCKECAEKGQGLWEVPVMRATPTPTPAPVKLYLVTIYQRGQ